MSADYPKAPSWQDNYELGRPGWPQEVTRVPGLPATATVADLGAGTGKLTQLLGSEFERVIPIEPDHEMHHFLKSRCPGVPIVAGTSDNIPLASRSLDAVFIAEAFHLFASDDAVSEISRVLRPEGTLVLMWNLPAGATEPPIDAVLRLLGERGPGKEHVGYDPSDLNPRRYALGEWRRPFAGSKFSEFQEARLPNVQLVDRDGLVAFFGSMGWITDLPDPEQLSLFAELRSLLPAARYQRPWQTRVHWARLEAAAPRPSHPASAG